MHACGGDVGSGVDGDGESGGDGERCGDGDVESGGDGENGGDVESGGDGDVERGGGDYKLQAASLTNDLTTASKTNPFQNLLITIPSSFSIWLSLTQLILGVLFSRRCIFFQQKTRNDLLLCVVLLLFVV